ncbi:hypothetical protein KJ751_00780 [Patescibacteria group bacterium]|nr:hypothetical protein [Patescibacteria group bacterium]
MLNGNLKKLKNRLYKRRKNFEDRTEGKEDGNNLSPPIEGVSTYWKNGEEKEEESRLKTIQSFNKMSRIKKGKKLILWGVFGSFLFMALSMGVVLYFLNYGLGGNVVSSKKIDIIIEGPSIINSGENNNWRIFITNNNEVSLMLSDLIIDYPEGSLMLEREQTSKERRSMGEIFPGETKQEELHIAILGSENDQKEIGITLEYRLEESNAIFAKTEKQIIKLSRSPIGISLNLSEEIESGQPMNIKLEYVSNSELILEDVYLMVEYPPGFKFAKASSEPVKDDNVWKIGDIGPGEKKNFEITGVLEGVDMIELGFNAFVGMINQDGEFIPFGSANDTVLLKRPFVNFGFMINGKDEDAVSLDNRRINVSVSWKNNLPTEIRNNNISLRLAGNDVVDFKTLSISKGFYKSYDNTIVWNSSSFPDLVSISPGESGSVNFSFELKDSFTVQNTNDKNFIFTINGEMFGERSMEGGQDVVVKSVAKKEVKITSQVNLESSLSSSPPPQVGKETTYTVIWSVSSFYNDISGVSVRSFLPSYVKWLDVVKPSGENIVYTASTGELKWNVGSVKAATGVLSPAKTVAFQISFLPAPSHEGSSPVLIPEAFLEGTDVFTGATIRDSSGELTIGPSKVIGQ